MGSIESVDMVSQDGRGSVRARIAVRLALAALVATVVAGLVPAVGLAQTGGPAWSLLVAGPDRIAPGTTFEYRLSPRNVGGADTDGTGAIDVTLPAGITGVSVVSGLSAITGLPPVSWTCADPTGASTVHCDTSFVVSAGQQALEELRLTVAVDPGASGASSTSFQMSGGGAASTASVSHAVNVNPIPDFKIKAFDGLVSDASGEAYTQAAGHPASAAVSFQLNRGMDRGYALADGGDLRGARVDLPAGLTGNPAAVPRCAKHLRIPTTSKRGTRGSTRMSSVRSTRSSGSWTSP